MKLIIDVSEEDIKRGQRWDSLKCPIARAARRALARVGIKTGVSAGHFLSLFRYTMVDGIRFADVTQKFRLPECALEFIRRFDARQPIQPFSFKIKTENL